MIDAARFGTRIERKTMGRTTTPDGKLVHHVFSAVTEFYREIIVENANLGMQAARRRGKHIGRPHALCSGSIAEALRAIAQDGRSLPDVAALLGVSRQTLDRALKRCGLV